MTRCPAPSFLLIAWVACSASACSSSNVADPIAPYEGTTDANTADGHKADASDAAASDGSAADVGLVDGSAVDVGAADGSTADTGPAALRVLFIGNSYTYVNELPAMLEKIATTSGAPPTIATDEVVEGSATLEIHWNNGIAQTKIEQGQWTHVVLQGQSMEPLFDPYSSVFLSYAKQFGDLIVDAGAQPTFFVTWARAAGDGVYAPVTGYFVVPAQMQDELTVAYAKAAQPFPQSILSCAGEAFKRSRTQYPAIVLQQSDLSHPTVAGTYLAACTFYVALTGKPVPSQSEVPAGLSAEDAADLRDIALVGTDCADVQVQGAIIASFGQDTDGGAPYDFGTAGMALTSQFTLKNTGGQAVGISDGMMLKPPFVWTDGGAYPGGSGPDFCSSSLAPGKTCSIAITYTAASTADGRVTLNLTDSYLPTATRALHGTATQRALLIASDSPGFTGCTDSCGPSNVNAHIGETRPLDVFVMNQGALPVTAIGEGAPLDPPFAWGGGAFPGGVGSVTWSGVSYPYCSAAALGVGAQCVVTVTFTPPALGISTSAVSLAYSDAVGPVLPDANRNIEGSCTNLPP